MFDARGVLLVAATAAGSLVVPDQMTDAMALLGDPPHLQTGAFLLSLTAAVLSLKYAASAAMKLSGRGSMRSLLPERMAVFIAMTPALAAAYLLIKSWGSSQLSGTPHARWVLAFTVVGVFAALTTQVLRPGWPWLAPDAKSKRPRVNAPRSARTLYWMAALGVATSCAILFGRPHYAGASAVGPICVVLLWVAAAAPVAAALSVIAGRLGLPVFSLLIGLALLFDYLKVNENNAVREVHGQRPSLHPTVEEAFEAWLLSRGDLAGYNANHPYPVFIVTAEGGGLSAAYFTAAVLASLQDACPQFAQHTFAISAVSGGSVGAAVFAAIANRSATNSASPPCVSLSFPRSGRLRRLAERTLSHDLLSPIIAATLFPNLLQQVLPWPIPAFDRARAFEHGLESSWQQAAGRSDFASTFDELEREFPSGAVPALFLTATNVETGLPMAVSTLRLCTEQSRSVSTLADQAPDLQLPLSTAVGLGARIPLIAPPGLIAVSGNESCRYTRGVRHFVDGAYFENSGTAVALQILERVSHTRLAGLPRFAIVVIDIGGWETLAMYPRHGMESFAPLSAILNARIGHGYLNRELLLDKIRELPALGLTAQTYSFRLRRPLGRVPLAWVLSRTSWAEISGQLPCVDGVLPSEQLRHPSCVTNAESFHAVLRLLGPQPTSSVVDAEMR